MGRPSCIAEINLYRQYYTRKLCGGIPLQIRGLLREVMPRRGITLPDGNHFPQGTLITLPFQAVHMDERFYPKSEEFDPFRFARMRTEGDRLDSAQTSDTYLAFSYSRHSWSVFSRYALLVPKSWCPSQTFIGLLLLRNIAQSRSLACFSNTQAPNRVHHSQLRHPTA